MAKVKLAEGFVSAEIKNLPKHVRFLHNAPDGAYITVSPHKASRGNSSNGWNATKAIPAGSLIISTEGGHLYVLNGNSGLTGLGKGSSNSYAHLMVQRVNMTVTVSAYRAQPKPKPTKKKAKKKKKKTKDKPKTRTTGRRW